MDERTPSWGITPVPERLRVLSFFDSLLLWGNLSVSLLVIVIGALLVPALSLRDAFLAILVGAVAGNVLLGLAAMIGADAPGWDVVCSRSAARRFYVPTALNVAQNLGWWAFELSSRDGGGALSPAPVRVQRQMDLTPPRRPCWGLGMPGPIGRAALPAQVRILGTPLLDGLPHVLGDLEVEPARLLGAARQGRFPDIRPGGRSRDRKHRLVDAAGCGLHALLARPARRLMGGGDRVPSAGDLVRRAGHPDRPRPRRLGRAGAARSGGGCRRDRVPGFGCDHRRREREGVRRHLLDCRLDPEPPAASVAAAADHARLRRGDRAVALNLGNYQDFLYLLGSFFVPLFGVLLADWLTRGAHYEPVDVFSAPAVRWAMLLCWFVGFALYQWLSPVGPHWWTAVVDNVHPGHARLTASLPSFAASFGLALAATWLRARIDSRRAAARRSREPLARPR
jgi:hypothetical protein